MVIVQFLSHPTLLPEGFSVLLRLDLFFFEVISPQALSVLLQGARLYCAVDKEPVHQGPGELLRSAGWIQCCQGSLYGCIPAPCAVDAVVRVILLTALGIREWLPALNQTWSSGGWCGEVYAVIGADRTVPCGSPPPSLVPGRCQWHLTGSHLYQGRSSHGCAISCPKMLVLSSCWYCLLLCL